MQNSLVVFIFSVLDWKLSAKDEISCLGWREYSEFNGDGHFLYFWPEIQFLGVNLIQKFKILDYFVYVKFDGDVHFFSFRLFLCKFCPKNPFGVLMLPD